MTAPRSRDERLDELVSIVNGIRFGMPGYDARLVELGAGFPGGSGGGGSKGSVSRPVEAQVIATVDEHRRDPATEAQRRLEHRITDAERALSALWDEVAEVAQVRMGVSKITDPGCEGCAQVPDHWCPTYVSMEITSAPKRKGQQPVVRKVRACFWCYQFARPDRAGRMPDHDEVAMHAQGKRVRWKVGA